MKKRLQHLLLATAATTFVNGTALAEPWTVGQQTITYSYPHVLGDGSNSRGGEAPAYASERSDIPTNASTGPNTNMPYGASPDGSSPNPVINLNVDQSVNANRYFPLPAGTSIGGAVLHSHQ
jgi:hypothetical protein